jgi:hypothetical protein
MSATAAVHPYEGVAPFIFASYARSDRRRVEPVLHELISRGVRIWWDRNLRPGEQYSSEIERRLGECKALLVFLSEASIAKKAENWVYVETKFAKEKGKEIIPVQLEQLALPLDWRALLETVQRVEAMDRDPTAIARELAEFAANLGCSNARAEANGGSAPGFQVDGSTRRTAEQRTSARTEGAGIHWMDACLRCVDSMHEALYVHYMPELAAREVHGVDDDYCESIDEPPEFAPHLPFSSDQDPRCERPREMVETVWSLDRIEGSIADRISEWSRACAKIPSSSDPGLSNALFLCHGMQLLELIRVFMDARHPPDTETVNLVSRFCSHAKCTSDGYFESALELFHILAIQLKVLQLEIPILGDTPPSNEIERARSLGMIAYTDPWRSRIAEARRLAERTWSFVGSGEASDRFNGPCSRALAAAWELADWIAQAYEHLHVDQDDHPIRYGSLPRDLTRQLDLGRSSPRRRGARALIRARELRPPRPTQASDAFEAKVLLPLSLPALDSDLDEDFLRSAEAHVSRSKFLSLIQAAEASPGTLRNRRMELLARLLLDPRVNPEIHGDSRMLEFARGFPRSRLGRLIVRSGRRGTKYWYPTEAHGVAVQRLLWVEARNAILHGDKDAIDALFLASRCDPSGSRMDACRLVPIDSAEKKDRARGFRDASERICMSDALSAGWLPRKFYRLNVHPLHLLRLLLP